MNIYEIDEMINSLDYIKDAKLITFYKKQRASLIVTITKKLAHIL